MNITNAYAVAGKPLPFPTYTSEDVWVSTIGNDTTVVYPGQFVLIKEEGWAIQSVFWKKHETGNPLLHTWTGLSVYADKDTPTSNNAYNTVDIVVTVEGLLPVGGGIVSLTALDPPNASGTGEPNNGFGMIIISNQLTFTNANRTKSTSARVAAKAGNNFIIKAEANNGQQGNFVLSETLTVWRRLWVECDQMAMPGTNIAYYIPGNPLPSEVFFAPSEKGITWDDKEIPNEPVTFDVRQQPLLPSVNYLKTLLLPACVDVAEYTANEKQVVDFIPNLTQLQTTYNNPHDYAIQGNNRSITDSTPTYWTTYVMSAYETHFSDHDNHAFPGSGINVAPNDGKLCRKIMGVNEGNAYVFYETIRDVAKTHGNCPNICTDVTGPLTSTSVLFDRVVAHEILHSFLGEHGSGSIADRGIMNAGYIIYARANCDLKLNQIVAIQAKSHPTPAGK